MNTKQQMRAVVIYVIASLFLFYEMAIQVSPSVMTLQLMRDFHITAGTLGIMASVYFYSYTLMQIPAGLLFDRFGPRTLITFASAICALGALFFSLTESVFWAAIGRLCMGLGSSFAFIGVLVVAARWFEGKYFAFLVGVAQLLAALGAICGEVPLSKAVNIYGWREVMYFLFILGLIITFISFLVLRDHPNHENYEILPKEHSLFKHLTQILVKGQTWAIAVYAFAMWGPVVLFASLWGVPYLMVKFEVSNVLAAFATMMMWLGVGLASPVFGFFSHYIGRRKPLLWIGSLIGLIASLFIIYLSMPFWLVFILLFLCGIASAGQILSFALVRDNNSRSVVATGIGFNNMAVVIGGAILQPIVGIILSRTWDGTIGKGGVHLYSVESFEIGLILIPALYLLGFLVSLLCIKETYCRSRFGP